MEKLPKYLWIAALILWAVGALALVLVVSSQLFLPGNAQVFGDTGRGWLLPAWIGAMAVLLAALILAKKLYKNEKYNLLAFILGLVGAAVALVVALELKGLLPEKVGLVYETQGISTWKLIWRHLTPVGAGVLVAVVAWIHRADARRARIAAENDSYKSVYDLPDEPVFRDARSEDQQNAPKRRKKKK